MSIAETYSDENNLSVILDAIQTINCHAGLFSHLESKYKNKNNMCQSILYKYKKEALYGIKGDVLDKIYTEANNIERHLMETRDYYCLYFYTPNELSFHRPVSQSSIDQSQVTDVRILTSFSKSHANEIDTENLIESIRIVNDVFGFDINTYIPNQYIIIKNELTFVGWDY